MDNCNHVVSSTMAVRRQALSARRLRRAKAAYTTRYVAREIAADPEGFELRSRPGMKPRSGDVVVARVEEIGQHTRIEMPDSRRALLFPGDEVILAFGNRYAPDQFEAEVPDSLASAHLVAAGGVAGRMVSRHARVEDPTMIEPLGLLYRNGEVVTLRSRAPFDIGQVPVSVTGTTTPVVAVLGTSMNSGKSTTVGALVRGLTAAGLDVAAGKVTGTGAGGDSRLFGDSGAGRVLDFTDFGYPSTYLLDFAEVRGLLAAIVAALTEDEPDIIVLEIADGIFQQETARLLSDPLFARLVNVVVFAAVDAIGAYAGRQLLADRGVRVAAVSGVLTSSPLALREAQSAVDVPVIVTDDLAQPGVTMPLLEPHMSAVTGELWEGLGGG